jgi:acetyl-CoA carboxylase carboxyltransferase component
MCGPAFGADCTLALPTAQIAIMGPQAAINAVFYNKIAELEGAEREEYIRKKQEEFSRDIDIFRLAGELIVDHVLPGSALREELCRRFTQYEGKAEPFSRRKHGVYPV